MARPLLTVDLDAVAENTRLFSHAAAGELIAVVKADGYGHGAEDVARVALANGAGRLGVTSVDEALALREAGVSAPILSWLNHPTRTDFGRAVAAGVDLAVPSLGHLAAVAGAGGTARVHLHLDTGMARDGCEPAAWAALCRSARAAELEGRLVVVGVMGHLGDADDPAAISNRTGIAQFEWGIEVARSSGLHPSLLHLAATAATLTLPGARFTAVRVGAGLVGIDPSRTARLAAPMTLTAPVLSVRHVPTGTAVGYGGDWRASRPTTLGLIGLGYADGLPFGASGHAQVLVGGRRRPVVGRMSMDQFVVDLTDAGARPGQVAMVFGPGGDGEPTLHEWAEWSGTIEHEIVTGLGRRVRRRRLCRSSVATAGATQ